MFEIEYGEHRREVSITVTAPFTNMVLVTVTMGRTGTLAGPTGPLHQRVPGPGPVRGPSRETSDREVEVGGSDRVQPRPEPWLGSVPWDQPRRSNYHYQATPI